MLQPLATWLVARPLNSIFGLAATLLLPLLSIISGIIMVLVALEKGPRAAVIEGIVAVAILTGAAMLSGLAVELVWASALLIWVPALLMALALRSTRSLTLTLQLTVVVAVVGLLGFHLVVDDVQAFWQPLMNEMLGWMQANQMTEQAQALEAEPAVVARLLSFMFVFSGWMMYVLYLLLGYYASEQVAQTDGRLGRFRDFSFGKVLAVALLVFSLLALTTSVAVFENVALMLFAAFWLQGLAVLHYLHAQEQLPLLALIVTYVLLPMLHFVLMAVLALFGYSDTWFQYRRLQQKEN